MAISQAAVIRRPIAVARTLLWALSLEAQNMIDSSLDASAVREALARIAKQADFLDVTVHTGRGASFHSSIEEACALLLSGGALAVRLSYRVAELAWSDTLTPARDGFRLLRVRRALRGGWALGGE